MSVALYSQTISFFTGLISRMARYTPPDGAVYLIDHTGFIYLMGRSGEFLGFFPPGTAADRMVEIINQHLGQHD